MRRLVVLEDRAFGASGAIPLWYDHGTGILHEMQQGE
jgi:hypothetical protein